MKTKICSICKKEKQITEFDKKRKWYLSYCKECRKEKRRQFYKLHREEEIKNARDYQEKNKEKVKQRAKIYHEKNKDKLKEYLKKWEREHKTYRNDYSNKMRIQKRKSDKVYALKCQTRIMLINSFKKKKFTKKILNNNILGCDYETFINHLLQTFKDNYGYEWNGKEPVHIDHIKALKYAKTEEEVIKLCHYTNLQLLKAKDNLEKSAKTNWELQK